MVIPSGIGVGQPSRSRVKPLLCSHQRGRAIHCNLPESERQRERERTEKRWCVVIYSLYHREFYGLGLWFWGEFYGLSKDGQLQFKSRAVSSLPQVGLWVWRVFFGEFCFICANVNFLYFKGIFYNPGSLVFINPTLSIWAEKKKIHFGGQSCIAGTTSLNISFVILAAASLTIGDLLCRTIRLLFFFLNSLT